MANKIPNFYIDKVTREPYFQMPSNHFHSEYEIYFLLTGTRKFFINHSFYTLHPNDFVLISKGELHRTSFIADASHERIVMYFNDIWLNHVVDTFGRDILNQCLATHKRSIAETDQLFISNLLEKMLDEYNSPTIYSNKLLQNYFEELLIFLLRTTSSNEYTNDNTANDADIVKAAQYICSNYAHDLTLKEVADYVNLSPTYFSKKFKDSTGFGFKEYLIHIRVKEAAHQLLETKDSITTIAARCGFTDSNYFGDLFRKVTKLSPREYRKKQSAY
ncbi:helix-turn-helix domain-containing protein [Anaerosporobacter sp.]|uniref:helix-turn-helix domain-containing protein n=1 Tax=Anaerosporobacter sp. TaxID=1872529 RepID=UPI00286F9F76|nr:AraC family transcriptional regulator [Anaerosporobacter sp.]